MDNNNNSKIIYPMVNDAEDLADGTKSLGEYCMRQLKLIGNNVALIDEDRGTEITGHVLLSRSIRVAECLRYNGFKSGDRIGVCSENQFEYCYLAFGSIFIGATLTTVSPFFTDIELQHTFGLSKPNIIFVSSSTVDKIHKLKCETNYIKQIILFGDDDKRCKSFESFLNDSRVKSSREEFHCPSQDIKNNVAVIFSSSGTTGPSKGVELTQLNLLSSLQLIPENNDITYVIPSPLSYYSGFNLMFGGLIRLNKTVLLKEFDPHTYLTCIEKYQMPIIFCNPTVINFIAKSPLITNYNLSSIRIIYTAGAAVSNKTIAMIQQRFPDVIILQAYGLTETGATLNQSLMYNSPGSVGTLTPGVIAKVVDPHTGEICGPNQPGELLLKSSRIMKGYVGNVEATKSAFDADGFFKTGDIAYYDETHEWYIIDRIKELIKYYGMQVYPTEIESVLMTHSGVRDACVVGLPHEDAGELPLAFVVKEDGRVTEKELMDYVAVRMSSQQHLRAGIIFIAQLPKTTTGSGKSLRRLLKEMAIKRKSKL